MMLLAYSCSTHPSRNTFISPSVATSPVSAVNKHTTSNNANEAVVLICKYGQLAVAVHQKLFDSRTLLLTATAPSF